jgi:proteasome lid subunit RPN8/RPN11
MGERTVLVHRLTDTHLAEIIRQAEAGYPEEICGIVIGEPGAPETYRVCQVRNVANEERQHDTTGTERDARTAYRMDDREVLRILREADDARWDVVMFYHSHPDHEAYFSAMDRDRALRVDQEPLWPGANYLVVSVQRGLAQEARYFAWDDVRKDFVAVTAALPAYER